MRSLTLFLSYWQHLVEGQSRFLDWKSGRKKYRYGDRTDDSSSLGRQVVVHLSLNDIYEKLPGNLGVGRGKEHQPRAEY